MVQSKADIPDTGVPLSNDGVIIIRLTSRSRTPAVRSALLQSEVLEQCRSRVAEAGFSLTPGWANGAVLLVPLTEEHLAELDVDVSHHHIIVLSEDVQAVRAALKAIPYKKRPKLSSTWHGAGGKRSRTETEPVSSPWAPGDNEAPTGYRDEGTDSDDSVDYGPVDVEIVHNFSQRTDSSVGLPQNPYMIAR